MITTRPRSCPGSSRRPSRIAASIPVYSAAWIPAVTRNVGPSRRPVMLLLIALLLSIGSVVGLLRLHPDARVDLLVDPGSAVYKDQALFADSFGADPVVVMAQPAPTRAARAEACSHSAASSALRRGW